MIAVTEPLTEVEGVQEYLVQIGLYGEPLRCRATGLPTLSRQARVVVATERGEMLARVLRLLRTIPSSEIESEGEAGGWTIIVRTVTAEDEQRLAERKQQSAQEFADWQARIAEWRLQLELVDLEWTLDGRRLMLYVLNDRGPESTKLALQAAAKGFGHLDVLPVSAEGLMSPGGGEKSGGCGCGSSGGCHS